LAFGSSLDVGCWTLDVDPGSSEGWHCSCSLSVMLDVTISILALIAGGVTMELFTIMQAPLNGNEAGLPWRAESADIAEDSQIGNPS
jgi:hypothetical protein